MDNKTEYQKNLGQLKRYEEKRIECSLKLEELRVSHNKELIFLHSNYQNQRKEAVNKYSKKKDSLTQQLDKIQADMIEVLENIEQKNNCILTNEVLGNVLNVIEEPSEFSLDEPSNEEAMDNLFNEMKGLLD